VNLRAGGFRPTGNVTGPSASRPGAGGIGLHFVGEVVEASPYDLFLNCFDLGTTAAGFVPGLSMACSVIESSTPGRGFVASPRGPCVGFSSGVRDTAESPWNPGPNPSRGSVELLRASRFTNLDTVRRRHGCNGASAFRNRIKACEHRRKASHGHRRDRSTTAPEFDTELARASGIVVVDLRKVPFMDSSGIRVLLNHKARLEETGGHVRLLVSTSDIMRIFELTGLTDFFEIDRSLHEPPDTRSTES
jgi:anti-sigma B factor antagonist